MLKILLKFFVSKTLQAVLTAQEAAKTNLSGQTLLIRGLTHNGYRDLAYDIQFSKSGCSLGVRAEEPSRKIIWRGKWAGIFIL